MSSAAAARAAPMIAAAPAPAPLVVVQVMTKSEKVFSISNTFSCIAKFLTHAQLASITGVNRGIMQNVLPMRSQIIYRSCLSFNEKLNSVPDVPSSFLVEELQLETDEVALCLQSVVWKVESLALVDSIKRNCGIANITISEAEKALAYKTVQRQFVSFVSAFATHFLKDRLASEFQEAPLPREVLNRIVLNFSRHESEAFW